MSRGYKARRALLVRRLQDRDGDICHYCKQNFPLRQYTFDHWMPRSKGGANTLSNIRLSCKPCNTAKGADLPEELAASAFKTWYLECRRCNDGNAIDTGDACSFCGQPGKIWKTKKSRAVVEANDVASMSDVPTDRRRRGSRAAQRDLRYTQTPPGQLQRQRAGGYRKAS